MKKLHLGCGEIYLDGYVNIDYPLDKHSAQTKSVADKYADLTTLRYKAGTVDEVRLHHVFEHFKRPTALALLFSWHSWLKDGGKVHIEVPDFERTAKVALSPFSSDRDRKVAMRHIFGSNEASWAIHYDGWTKKRLAEIVELAGFRVKTIKQTKYLATRNITIEAVKITVTPNRKKLDNKAKAYLNLFTVDDSRSEKRVLEVWFNEYMTQIAKTLAR